MVSDLEALRIDPRVAEAKRRLTKSGITEDLWTELLECVAALPARHAEVVRETAPEAAQRRRRLAKHMKSLAKDIKADREAQGYVPHPRAGTRPGMIVNDLGSPDFPALWQWLDDAAEHLEAEAPPLLGARYGQELKSFVAKGAAHWIEHYLCCVAAHKQVARRRARNVEAALLASAVLGEDVRPNDVAQACRKVRRRYAPRE